MILDILSKKFKIFLHLKYLLIKLLTVCATLCLILFLYSFSLCTINNLLIFFFHANKVTQIEKIIDIIWNNMDRDQRNNSRTR